MRLRSGKLRIEVDSDVAIGIERAELPDLNLIDDGNDIFSSEEGVMKSTEVSGVDEKSNVEVCVGGIAAIEECKPVEIDNEGSAKGLVSYAGCLLPCPKIVDHYDGVGLQDVVSGDGDGNGNGNGNEVEEGVSCSPGLASGNPYLNPAVVKGSDVIRSLYDENKVVHKGEDVEMKERGSDDVGIGDEGCCAEGLAPVFVDFSTCASVDGTLKSQMKEDLVDCDLDLSRSLPPDSGTLEEGCKRSNANEGLESRSTGRGSGKLLEGEAEKGGVQSVGRVLRSRIVPANGLGGEARVAQTRATPSKRKRDALDCTALVVLAKDELTDSVVVSELDRSSERPNGSASHFNRGVSETNKVKHTPKAQDECVDLKSVSSTVRKRKRGRPKKCADQSEQAEMEEVDVASLVVKEELSLVSEPNLEEGVNERKKSINCPKEEDEVRVVEKSGDVSQKSGGGSLVRRSGRPKRIVDYSEQEVIQRKKKSGRKVSSDEEDEEDESPSNISITVPTKKGKRGRPKKEDGNGTLQMVLYDENIAKAQKTVVSPATATVRRCRQDSSRQNVVPEKRTARVSGRKGISSDKEEPAGRVPGRKGISSDKEEPTGRVSGTKRISFDKQEHTGRVSGRKGISSDKNVKHKMDAVETPSKGQETRSSSPRRGMRGSDIPGTLAAEKNAVRIQIVDMLLAAGWTVEYRPRNGREYKDAVYVNHEGKTHWSVTKAYFQLKQEFEEGLVSSFTPLPEDLLAKLFRVVSKTRSDAQKKKKPIGNGNRGANRKYFNKGKSTRDWSETRRRYCTLVARKSKGSSSEKDVAIAHSGKHSILAWMIDSAVLKSEEKVHYMNGCKTKALLEGSITRDGINCHCCKDLFSISEFEKHAGGKDCQPYENLCLESGQSLLQCLLDTWSKQKAVSYHIVDADIDDPNDDTCAICGDGGDLMCCDGCPSTFHHDCLDIEDIPSGEWHCVFCSCKYCGAGDSETESTDDGDTASSSMVACCVCKEKYHLRCADEVDAVQVKPGGATFCGKDCEKIFEGLQRFLGVKHDLGDGFSWTLLQHSDVKEEAVASNSEKIVTNSKLAVALSVMDECFMPIIDPRSGVNLIRHVVFNCGSNFTRVNFSSFLTVVLEKGNEAIAAASIRIHGKQLAEMPFIGTRNSYRRQGMCRRLLSAIEKVLGSLDVENLVIPAIPELIDTWTSVFGFKTLKDSVREGMKSMNMLVFAHIDMLQKPISKHIVEKAISIIENDANCFKSLNEKLDGGPDMSEVDNGCLNTEIDLNVVVPIIPESSSDERHGIAGHFEDNVKCSIDSGQLHDASKVDGKQSVMENVADQVENSYFDSVLLNDVDKVECLPSVKENGNAHVEISVVVSTSEGRTLQPDLNVTDTMYDDSVSPELVEGSSAVKTSVDTCPVAENANESAKSCPPFHGPTKLKACSVLLVNSDYNGHSSVKPNLDVMGDRISDNDGCLPLNLNDHAGGDGLPGDINCHNSQTSSDGHTIRPCALKDSSEAGPERSDIIALDYHRSGAVASHTDCQDISAGVKHSLKCKVLETNRTVLSIGNEVPSNDSGELQPGNCVECYISDSHGHLNGSLVNSNSSCNIGHI